MLGHFWPFWIILGHSRAMLDHFGPLWGIFGHFWPFLGHFVAYLEKFAEGSIFFADLLGSRYSLFECMIYFHPQVKRLTDSFRTRDKEMKGQALLGYEDFVGLAIGAHR